MTEKTNRTVSGSLSQLADLVNQAGLRLKPQNTIPISKGGSQKALVTHSEIPETASELSDEEFFLEAMSGVDRVSWRHYPYPSPKPAPAPAQDSDLDARRLMQEAVDGNSAMPILNHPEYIEGWVGAAGKRFLPNLRNEQYSIQGQIDLHGLSRAEAQAAVEDYIVRMSRFRCCCVKIIHGRGINSPTDRATLKESLQHLLSTRKMARYVVAYASAPPNDGGVGAVYVLLGRR